MKKYLLPSLKLTLALIVIVCMLYPLLISGVAKMAPGGGDGVTVKKNGKVVGYENIAQAFTSDAYFQPRPSAVGYNAAGSGGSNKSATNAEYLQTVQARIDSFIAHNPGLDRKDIPAELVTASGSGLDPDLSPAAAMIQVKRIAALRQVQEQALKDLVTAQTESQWPGPDKVNVLKLNIALDKMDEQN